MAYGRIYGGLRIDQLPFPAGAEGRSRDYISVKLSRSFFMTSFPFFPLELLFVATFILCTFIW
jgi:hypothetical protein